MLILVHKEECSCQRDATYSGGNSEPLTDPSHKQHRAYSNLLQYDAPVVRRHFVTQPSERARRVIRTGLDSLYGAIGCCELPRRDGIEERLSRQLMKYDEGG